MRKLKFNKLLHKWISLVVGIQLIIWVGTGLYFNLMDHEKASGNALRQSVNHESGLSDFRLLDLSGFSENRARVVKLQWIMGHPYYQFIYALSPHRYQPHESELVDAVTGERYELGKDIVRQIALASYIGDDSVDSVELVNPPISDMPKEQNPLWRVSIQDPSGTNIYIDPQTGKVLRHVNDDYRLRDLMFMLHFMDYFGTGGFNHWLIIIFAFGTLMLATSGCIWVIELLSNGQFTLAKRSQNKRVTLSYRDTGVEETHLLLTNASLLDSLAEQHVYLPSSCGGGGTCGKCKFIANKSLATTTADKEHLTKDELAQGYRLGCQHSASELSRMEFDTRLVRDVLLLRVSSTQFITPFIKEIAFTVASGKKLRFKAGAYLQFYIPPAVNSRVPREIPDKFLRYWDGYHKGEYEHTGTVRSYSIANFDTETDELIFNVRWQTASDKNQPAGIGSGYLGALKVGDTIEASGPFSDFFARENSANKRVFVAAGSGMAPIRAIIFEQLKKAKSKNEMLFIFGARTEDDLLYRDDFEALAQQYQHFMFRPVLSRPGKNWSGECGYVQDVLTPYLSEQPNLANVEFYLCGPAPMMLATQRILLTAGVKPGQILKDDFTR